MSSLVRPAVVGRGAASSALAADELREIVYEALGDVEPGERVLAIIADKTRDDNTSTLFPFAAQILADKGVSQFDALVAQGTHGVMTTAEKLAKVGASNGPLPSWTRFSITDGTSPRN